MSALTSTRSDQPARTLMGRLTAEIALGDLLADHLRAVGNAVAGAIQHQLARAAGARILCRRRADAEHCG